MKGDFTRSTFRPTKHHSSVRLQQGRILLDADWNEQADIQVHRDRTTVRDVVGISGAPLRDAGFALSVEGGNLKIGRGRYYVDGILCENEEDVTFAVTPVLSGVPNQPDLPEGHLPTDPGRYLAYLDVWERHITALEDPTIREVALGGPDTTTRSQTVWQVKLEQVDPNASRGVFDAAGWTPKNAGSTGRLRARARRGVASDDSDPESTGFGYRRLENQLYRVEVHDGSEEPSGPTFVWSRDNAIVATRLTGINGNLLTVSDPGKDTVLGFAGGRWVELSDEERTLRGEPGILVELASVNGNDLEVSSWPDNTPLTMDDFGAQPTVRLWSSKEGPIQATTEMWHDLEDGVQVQFDAGDYRTGDYWLIPARSLKGSVEWPRTAPDSQGNTEPLFETRHGIQHHYRPLALLQLANNTWTLESDRRRLFAPLAEDTDVHVVEVFLRSTEQPLRHGIEVPSDQLAQGIRMVCAAIVDPDVVKERHRCLVALEMPFDDPSTGAMIGFQPLILASETNTSGRELLWSPSDTVQKWLEDRLFDSPQDEPLTAHLRLEGSPFEMGFRVVPSKDIQINIGFLPNIKSELFSEAARRLDLMAEAVNFAIDRDKLREVLPIGYETAENQYEPERARDRIRFLISFRGLPERPSGTMVVDERFADAGRLVAEMLRSIPDAPVNFDLIIDADVLSMVDNALGRSRGALPTMVVCDQGTADELTNKHGTNFPSGMLERF